MGRWESPRMTGAGRQRDLARRARTRRLTLTEPSHHSQQLLTPLTTVSPELMTKARGPKLVQKSLQLGTVMHYPSRASAPALQEESTRSNKGPLHPHILRRPWSSHPWSPQASVLEPEASCSRSLGLTLTIGSLNNRRRQITRPLLWKRASCSWSRAGICTDTIAGRWSTKVWGPQRCQ